MTEPAGRWRALAWIAAAQVGAMSTWFSAAAVAPSLQHDWHLSPAQLALLTVAVQLGFVTGGLASAVSGIADVLPARRVFIGSALAAALLNALLVPAGGNLALAVLARFGLGFFLAGVYPTGMKLMAGWFRAGRGLAIGTLVGALTLGAALPHLVAGVGLAGALPWQSVITTTSLGAVTSAVLVALFVRAGPFESRTDRLDLGWALRSLRAPAMRLANLGYLGHMWELYAMWTWVPVFLLASFRQWDSAGPALSAGRGASLAAALVIGTGALGCVAGGLLADRQRPGPADRPGLPADGREHSAPAAHSGAIGVAGGVHRPGRGPGARRGRNAAAAAASRGFEVGRRAAVMVYGPPGVGQVCNRTPGTPDGRSDSLLAR